MDWNQISNYAARHTHKKLGLGEARASGRSARDSRSRGGQTPGAKCVARAPRGLRAPRLRPRPAGGHAQGWGEVSVLPLRPGLRTEGPPEEGCRGHRPGRTFQPCGPTALAALPSAAGWEHRRRPTPCCPSPPPWTGPQSQGLCKEVSGWLGPWVWDTHTNSARPHTQKRAHTHTDSCSDTSPAVAPFPAQSPPFQRRRPRGPH